MHRKGASVVSDGVVNLSKLEQTIASALEQDQRYKRENDAKFRAVAQKVQTYEEFEGIVKASHIKPITEDITNLSLGRSAWNTTSRPRASEDDAPTSIPARKATDSSFPPATDRLFLREWKALPGRAAKFKYLVDVGAEHLGLLFRAEVGHGLLGEFVLALDEGVLEENVTTVAAILRALAGTGRFALMLEFFSKDEMKGLASLLQKLDELHVEGVETLKKMYSVS